MKENDIAREIVDAALIVHKELGPGLLESVYEKALSIELARRNLVVERQVGIPVVFRGEKLDI